MPDNYAKLRGQALPFLSGRRQDMKIGIAQINTKVGDFQGNLEKIRKFYGDAGGSGVDLVLFPELAVCGYAPQDLLERPSFVRDSLQALKALAKDVKDVGLLIGCVEPNPAKTGKPLFNAAVLLHNKKVAAKRFKTLLPSYDVFDEGRYFEPAPENKPIRFGGRVLGVTICEDAWNDPDFWHGRRYSVDPVKQQADDGAEIIINIAASPYERGKRQLRRELMRRHAQRTKRPVVTCALVGGDDELIFDGGSFALDAKGGLVLQAKAFEEDLVVINPEAEVPEAAWQDLEEAEEVYRALVLGLRDYVGKCGFTDVLLGLSGGIDSAVSCALAADALGPEHVTGVAMPSMYSSEGSLADAEALARNLGINLYALPITDAYGAVAKALGEVFRGTEPGTAEQNIQARLRGTLLMSISNKFGSLLLSTGNKSELSVGYCTLYGDMNGGLAVIADVPKTLVYKLARWINREAERIPESSITKPPSAELKPDQVDQDDLPPYETLDAIIQAYVEEGKDASVIARSIKDKALVERIIGMIDRNEYKRRQAPPALRVSSKAFGIGRRIPIARA